MSPAQPSPSRCSAQQFPERPFTDPGLLPALYADQTRVRRRSRSLLDAKIEGRHVGELIAELLQTAAPTLATPPALITDIGCGTGQPTRTLAQRFPHARLLAIDISAPMLTAARAHLRDQLATQGDRVSYLRADFHHLPLTAAAYHFRDAYHLAEYLTTVPKHPLPEPLRTTPAALAAELRRRRGEGPITTTSTITCVLARKPPRP